MLDLLYTIRQGNEADKEFVWQQHLKANQVYIDRHMDVSYEVNRAYFDKSFPQQLCFIIEQKNEVVGCYCINEYDNSVHLSRLFLLDEAQGQGIGQNIVKSLLEKYYKQNKAISINVWVDNPVQDFWQKMGFVYDSTDSDNLMKLVAKVK